MAATRVGSPAYGGVTGGTTITVTLPQTPTAGNLLLAAVVIARASGTPTCTTPTGWTAGPAPVGTSGTNRIGLFLFWKLATGSEGNPSVTITSGSGQAIVEEWSGLHATTPHDADSTGQVHSGTGTGITLTDAITTGGTSKWLWGGVGATTSTAATGLQNVAWTSPLASETSVNAQNSSRLTTGAGVFSGSGAQSPAVTVDSTASTFQAAAYMSFTTGTNTVTGTAAATLGSVTASATGVRTRIGTAAVVLGAVAAAATGTVDHHAAATTTLGAVNASASGVHTAVGAAATTLGAVAAAATGASTPPGTAATALGTVTAAASGVRSVIGAASTTLGSVTASASGTVTVPTPDIPDDIPDAPAAYEYDPTGFTLIGRIDDAIDPKSLRRIGLVGACSLSVLLNHPRAAALATEDKLIKVSARGAIRNGFRPQQSHVDHVKAKGARRLEFTDQPDFFDLLNDGEVQPEFGLKRRSGQRRSLGPMSHDYDASAWDLPLGYAIGDPLMLAKQNHPADIVSWNPAWIGADDPTVDQPVGTVWWLIRDYTPSVRMSARWIGSFDNFGGCWLAGEESLTPDQTDMYAWRRAVQFDAILEADVTYRFCFKVENADRTIGLNSMGMIGGLWQLNASTGEEENLLFKTDLVSWKAAVAPQGYTRAGHFLKLHAEAVTAGARGPSILTPTFTADADSNDDPFTDAPDVYTVDIGRPLGDVLSELSEQGFDAWVDAAAMTIPAAVQKGADLSATEQISVSPIDGTMSRHQSTLTKPRFNVVRAQLADGTWMEAVDAASVTAHGRRETTVTLGEVHTRAAAQAFIDAQLAAFAQIQFGTDTQTVSVTGSQLFIDYNMGDVLGLLDDHLETGAMVKMRALDEAFDGSKMPAEFYPSTLVQIPDDE